MKAKFTLCIAIITQVCFAQQNKPWLSLGAGIANVSNTSKDNLIGNGFNLQADAFVPLYTKGNNFALGFNVAGNYTGLKNLNPNNSEVSDQYQIHGGSLSVTSKSEATTSSSFSGLAGIQANFSFGKVMISPSINSGYLTMKQGGYSQNGNASINGQTLEKELIKSEQQRNSGLVFKPQVRVGYKLASNLSFFISPSASIGPEFNRTVQYLVPQGGFNDRKIYEAKQLAAGTWESKTTTHRYSLTEINFGISVALGKKKAPKNIVKPGGAVSSSYAKVTSSGSTHPTPNNATDFNTTRNNRERGQLKKRDTLFQEWDNAIAEHNLNTKGSTDSSTINQRLSMTPTTKQTQGKTFGESIANGLQGNPLYQGSGKSGDNPMYEPKKMAATTPRQSQANTFGEKVSSGLQEVTKGSNKDTLQLRGQNNNTVRSNRGDNNIKTSVEPSVPQKAEAQDFNTTRSNREGSGTHQLKAQNNNTIRSGREESEKKKTVKQSQGQTFGEKAASGLQSGANIVGQEASLLGGDAGSVTNAQSAKPGQPIGGIVVKGGKNPGGNMRLVSNENGEVILNGLQKGNYLFKLTATQTAQKSINEKGVKRSEEMAKPGQPIGGIVVKGGKNPGGSFINLTVNDRGQIGFEVTEAGNYIIKIQTPDVQPAKNQTEKGEKATSGLKDTLKTNV